jgi:hypothetical protein
MFRAILNAFRREPWNCKERYGVSPEVLLATALQLVPEGSLLEVSFEEAGVIPAEYTRSAEHRALISRDGDSFLVSAEFSGRYGEDLKNLRVAVPEIYCLIGSDMILLSVVNRSEILDGAKPFLKLLDARLGRAV